MCRRAFDLVRGICLCTAYEFWLICMKWLSLNTSACVESITCSQVFVTYLPEQGTNCDGHLFEWEHLGINWLAEGRKPNFYQLLCRRVWSWRAGIFAVAEQKLNLIFWSLKIERERLVWRNSQKEQRLWRGREHCWWQGCINCSEVGRRDKKHIAFMVRTNLLPREWCTRKKKKTWNPHVAQHRLCLLL